SPSWSTQSARPAPTAGTARRRIPRRSCRPTSSWAAYPDETPRAASGRASRSGGRDQPPGSCVPQPEGAVEMAGRDPLAVGRDSGGRRRLRGKRLGLVAWGAPDDPRLAPRSEDGQAPVTRYRENLRERRRVRRGEARELARIAGLARRPAFEPPAS